MPRTPESSRLIHPARRTFMLGVLACTLPALPIGAEEKRQPAPGETSQTPKTAPPRRFTLRAQSFSGKLIAAQPGESALERLVLVENAPATSDAPKTLPAFPVLRTREGEAFDIAIENTLTSPLGLHLRGMRGPNAADGVPGLTQAPIAPGGKFTLSFPGTQAGTFLLQASLSEQAAAQNARGVFAVVIVEEKGADASLYDHDLVLAFSDWRLDEKGALQEEFGALPDAARLGRLGNTLSVNNAPAPASMSVRPGARIRVRMINVANARVVPLKVSGYPTQVFAIDSTPCQPFDPLRRTVIMAPATRIEMVLEAPQDEGRAGAVEAKLGDGLPLYTFRTAGKPIAPRGVLAALPDPGLPPAIRLQDATRARLVIEGGIGLKPEEAEPAALKKRFPDASKVYTLTSPGLKGALGGFAAAPLARLKRNGVLVLGLENRTAWPQVIGVHGHAFRLLHPFDDGWEPYFLDTLYMAPKTSAHIALIAENSGKWAIRSTIAEHFGSGVSTWFDVT